MGVDHQKIVPEGSLTDPGHVGSQADVMANPYDRKTVDYDRLRPPYPPQALRDIASIITTSPSALPTLLDIGSGTGTFLRQLFNYVDASAITSYALDPSPAMASGFHATNTTFFCAPAEDIPLPDKSCSAVTCAQAWHWCDPDKAGYQVARVLNENAPFIIVFNQLNVSIPWVKRLSRIMRSGDVHHPDKPPYLPSYFAPPTLKLYSFTHSLYPHQIVSLGKTRSSYLRASAAGKDHMTSNLRWYLYEHMGFSDDEKVELPYLCLVWHTHTV